MNIGPLVNDVCEMWFHNRKRCYELTCIVSHFMISDTATELEARAQFYWKFNIVSSGERLLNIDQD